MTRDARAMARLMGAVLVAAAAAVLLLKPVAAPRAQQTPAALVAPEIKDTNSLAGPRQPVFFRHDVHAGQYQLDCKYCHYSVEYAAYPGIPSMRTCMGCHILAGAAIPQVQRVREAATSNKAIEWVKVHHLPPFVHFPHMRHVKGPAAVKAGIACQTCHGQVQTMPQVYQFASLKMGWCLDCHKQNKVTTDCTACHY